MHITMSNDRIILRTFRSTLNNNNIKKLYIISSSYLYFKEYRCNGSFSIGIGSEETVAMSVYNYNDYRLFLRDETARLRRKNRNLSIREMLRRVGISSPSYYKEVVVDAKKNMSPAMARKFAWYLKLDKNETEYFAALVGFNQARTEIDRNRHYEKIIGFTHKESIESKFLSIDEYKYISSWEIPAIREALQFHKNFGNRDAKERKQLADRFLPKVTEEQVAQAIRLLESLGFIKKDSRGNFHGTRLSLRCKEKTPAAYALLCQNIKHAQEIINRASRESRVFRALIVNISKQSYDLIESKVNEFCKEVLEIASNDSCEADRLYSLGIQFFPLMKIPEDGEK